MTLDPTPTPEWDDARQDEQPDRDHAREDLTAILNDLPATEPTDSALPGVPMARPITATAISSPVTPAYGPTPPERPLSALQAVIELVLVVPASIAGSVIAYLIALVCAPHDERWLRIADSLGLGFGAAAACLLMVYLGRRRLESIGWTSRRSGTNVLIGCIALLATYALLITLGTAIVLAWPDLLPQSSRAQEAIEKNFPRMPAGVVLVILLCVAFYEEVIFRGFLLTRLQAILRRWWLTIPIGSLAFGLLHFYEGLFAVAVITFLGLVMAVLFVWRKSLVPCMTLHLIHNFLIFQLLQTFSPTWK